MSEHGDQPADLRSGRHDGGGENTRSASDAEGIFVAFPSVLDSDPDPAYVKDENLRYVYLNPKACERLGIRAPEEALGKTDADLGAAISHNWLHELESAVLKNGTPLFDVAASEPIGVDEGLPARVSVAPVIVRGDESRGIVVMFQKSLIGPPATGLGRTERGSAPGWDGWIRPDGALVWVQLAVERFTGYSPGDCLAMTDFPLPLLQEADRAALAEAMSRSIAQGEACDSLPVEIQRKDGGRWAGVFVCTPVRDAGGNCVGHRVQFREAGAHKDSPGHDGGSETERLRLILDATADGAWDVDLRTREVHVSRRWAETLGYGIHEVPSKFDECLELIHPSDRPLVERCIEEHIEGRSPRLEVELRMRNAEGQWQWVICRGKVVAWDENLEATRMVGTHTDLTEKKRAETARLESEARYRAALDGMPEMIHVVDRDLRIVLFNRSFKAWVQKLGVEIEPLEGRTVFEVFPFLPAEARHEYERVLREGLPLETDDETQLDGQTIHTKTWKLPLNERGQVTGIMTVVRDTTREAQAREALLANSRIEATQALAGGVSHRFNNLMAAVLGTASLARSELGEHNPTSESLAKIESVAREACSLAQQIQAYASGRRLYRQEVDANEVIRSVLEFEGRGIPPRIELTCDLAEDVLKVNGDPAQLGAAMVSLCSNGVEAMPGTGCLTIRTRNVDCTEGAPDLTEGAKPGAYVCLSVEDTGEGMSPDVRERLFEPFFSTKRHGRGLGMAAVHGIVQGHGGHIKVDSAEGKGTIVRIYLPALPDDAGGSAPPPPPPKGGDETVLVVDDEEMLLNITKLYLKRHGYTPLLARNGKEAVDIAKSHDGEIALAILDIVMPIMDGVEAYPLLKEARPDMKVVVVSGYSVDAHAGKILDAGAEHFLHKPYQADELMRVIRRLLDDRERSSSAS